MGKEICFWVVTREILSQAALKRRVTQNLNAFP